MIVSIDYLKMTKNKRKKEMMHIMQKRMALMKLM